MEMESQAMNDELFRRLRPVPRAAFVHELKARLDRQPTVRLGARRPSVLRTLIVALLIGGAAFAMTMMSAQRKAAVEQSAAPALAPQQSVAEGSESLPPPPPVQLRKEGTPVATRNAVREVEPPLLPAFPEASQSRPEAANAARALSELAQAPSTQVVTGIAFGGLAGARSIEGAGTGFPGPVYEAWAKEFLRLTGVSVQYESLRSGDGAKLLQKNQLAFAATDVPWQAEALEEAGLFQFPVVASAVVPIVRLSGVPAWQVTLDGPTLASIYLGEITRWNDNRIRKLNPGLTLPGTRITLIFRSDGAAATYFFTEYLSKASMSFQSRYSVRAEIDVSPGTAARGNDGMADLVERTEGAIGYLDYNYAQAHAILPIRLINRNARVVPATRVSIQSAVAHADWAGAPGLAASLADMPGEQSWPIVGASYIMVRSHVDPTATRAALQFFDWGYRNGSATAAQLGYVTMPPGVADLVRAAWSASVKGAPKSTAKK
jgi:phosphate transport system substrate-binding protein